MKLSVFLLCLLICFFSLSGCQNENIECVLPVQLYYCNSNVDFHSEQPVIASEIRDFDGWQEKSRDFLNQYLTGPVSPELKSPFPLGAWIIELSNEENTVNVLLNSNFSRLSPNELTVACACLSMTIFELYSSETVQIRISSYTSDYDEIIMTRENLSLIDNTQIQ